MRITTSTAMLGRTATAEVRRRLRAARLDQVLVSNAKRRVRNRGDSTHRYPDLWASRRGLGYRQGGSPLQDTGRLLASLTGRTTPTSTGVRVSLIDGSGYGVMHQNGFKTDGPNFIPLTLRARRRHRKGANPEDEGLVRGEDFIMAWHGVDVPQRKIFNMPPEDAAELSEAATVAMGVGRG